MKIILLNDIKNLGLKNTIVTVKNGYANNFLIPQGHAIIANRINKKQLEQKLNNYKTKHEKMLNQANSIKDVLMKSIIIIKTKVGNNNKIFGSITPIKISEIIKQQYGININRKNISIDELNIRSIGFYNATIDLYDNVKFNIKFEIKKD